MADRKRDIYNPVVARLKERRDEVEAELATLNRAIAEAMLAETRLATLEENANG